LFKLFERTIGGSRQETARDRAAGVREPSDAPECASDAAPIKPQRAVAETEAAVDADTVVAADSGTDGFWSLTHLQTPAVRTHFGSGGVGAMGWATPTAVATALTTDRDVIAVAGDVGFATRMTSVETAVEHGVVPAFVVLDDTSPRIVRQMQDGACSTGKWAARQATAGG
jgi:acetolactate synthase-1/2/3 large subunit